MNSHEMWQVDVQGIVYEASIEEIVEWIKEGSIQPEDKVCKGSLRWLKVDKVPELYKHFHGNNFQNNSSVTTSIIDAVRREEIAGSNPKDIELIKSFLSDSAEKPQQKIEYFAKEKVILNTTEQTTNASPVSTTACSVHPNVEARYFCGTCLRLFCKNCPESFGGNVKICIDCGAMCRVYTGEESLIKSVGAMNKPYPRGEFEQNNRKNSLLGNFGFTDFARAIVYPFRFKTSLIFGAILFMILMLGQTASAFGISMYFAAVICLMLANTLVFGCLANTLDNFAQGKTNLNFMPSFDEFELWDDVIHPFLLGFGVYIVSFGLFFILLFGALWQTSNSENKIEEDKQKIVSTVLPRVQNILNSGGQNSQTAQIIEQLKQNNKVQNGNLSTETDVARLQQDKANEAANVQKLQEEVLRNLQIQAEDSTNIENGKGLFDHTIGTILRLSLVFSVPIFIAFLWGIFYFPAACAIAGYTRSFKETINPLVAFDTIKRLGPDYFKSVVIFTAFIALGVGLNAVLQSLLSSVNLPMLGNLPAKAIVSVFAFYLSVVFSVALGIVLSNNSAKLNFRHN